MWVVCACPTCPVYIPLQALYHRIPIGVKFGIVFLKSLFQLPIEVVLVYDGIGVGARGVIQLRMRLGIAMLGGGGAGQRVRGRIGLRVSIRRKVWIDH